MSPSGYAHAGYADSLSEFGTVRRLPESGGSILVRSIPSFPDVDAIGCYPVFACADWTKLADDLAALEGKLLSLLVTPDLFAPFAENDYRHLFPALARPYKEHHVIDFRRPLEVTRHHRKTARQALRRVTVDVLERPDEPCVLEEWLPLHAHLVARHGITGVRAFSRTAFEKQLALPGATVVRARREGHVVGAQIWLSHGGFAFGHVLALSPEGYRLGAGYALYATAIEHFRSRVEACDIGALPDETEEEAGGLRWFKQGWSKATRTAWICGRIFDMRRYDELVRLRASVRQDFFPAYRDGL